MTTERYQEAWDDYRGALTRVYGQGVESLIASEEATEVENPEEPIEEALQSSTRLTEATGERADGGDPEDRQLAILQLAAGADVDLGVAADLARREDQPAVQGLVEEARKASLSFALPGADAVLSARTLGDIPEVPASDPEAKAQAESVEDAIESTIAKIRDQAAAGGQDVVRGVTVVGVPLGDALGAVATGAIGALGKEFGFFIRKAVAFLSRAVEKLLRLLGTDFTNAIAEKLKDLLKDAKEGNLLADLLKRVWGTDAIEAEAKEKVTGAGAKLTEERAGAAIEKLKQLQAAYEKQTGLVRKVLKGVAVLQGFIVHIQPAGPLALGAGYAAVLVFLTLSGADYVDWQRADLDGFFDRVPGVRHIVDAAVA